MEWMFHRKLIAFFEKNDLQTYTQNVLWPGRSCLIIAFVALRLGTKVAAQQLKCGQDIAWLCKSLWHSQPWCDLSVNHGMIYQSTMVWFIRSCMIAWSWHSRKTLRMATWLSKRSQVVVVSEATSEEIKIMSGILQGIILELLLFIMALLDKLLAAQEAMIVSNADNTQVTQTI